MSIPYTVTNESVTLIWKGIPLTVPKGAVNFNALRAALLNERWEDVPGHLTQAGSLEVWAKGKFKVQGEVVTYDGKPLPVSLNHRISEMARAGEDPNILFRFWEKLSKNPSHRSVNQLFDFLQHMNIPLTSDGEFLAYKSVRQNYTDHHTGKHDNSPGQILRMSRNEISDDPEVPCHVGMHVGDITYAQTFGGEASRIVVCKINPEHVVCVPKDESFRKMRVCQYEVIGNHGSNLPSTIFEPVQKKPLSVKRPNPGKRKPFAKMDAMDMKSLMGQSINNLRQYAGKGLNIIGASKIPGGKTALVFKILEVRRK